MRRLFLSPHQDDESLFGAYTLMREKPMVLFCTTPIIQEKKGLEASMSQRLSESAAAMRVLGLDFNTLPIMDEDLNEEDLEFELSGFVGLYSHVYAPAIEGYQKQHDMVGRVAEKLWPGNVTHYKTYTEHDFHTVGKISIVPTQEEMDLKNKALDCYTSQIRYNSPHFDAVRNQPEYYEN